MKYSSEDIQMALSYAPVREREVGKNALAALEAEVERLEAEDKLQRKMYADLGDKSVPEAWLAKEKACVKVLEAENGPCGECIRTAYKIRILKKRVKELEELYSELIMAVSSKHEGKTRHQTALRYIQERETSPQAVSVRKALKE